MMKILSILALMISCFFHNTLTAQSLERTVVATAGTSAQAGNIQLDYTVGESVVAALEGATISLAQGFQQGELMATGLSGLPTQVSYKVYPNPVGEELHFAMEGPDLDFQVILYDVNGRPLADARRQVKGSGYWQEHFDLSQQPSGAYFLVILDGRGTWLQSHRVVKP